MLASAALLTLIVVAVARAQSPAEDPPYDVGVACQEASSNAASCDTEYTPVAKDPAEGTWSRIGGAEFGKTYDEDHPLEGSPTPYTVDFYSVRFSPLTPDLGFAGGAACPDDTPFEELHDDYCGPSASEGVPRVPVIYRYLDPDGSGGEEDGRWEEVHRGTSKGYVGSIGFDASGRAIAVGGTGNYPRRELPWCKKISGEDPASAAVRCQGATGADYVARDLAGEEPNAAGSALAWTYEGDDWEDVDLPPTEQGDPLRGLSAVDCSTRLTDGDRCLAGGLRQLWLWQGGQVTKSFTDKTPAPDVRPAGSFLYRVRDIAFVPGTETPAFQAVAVTSGCCTGNEALDHPNAITFDGEHALLRPGVVDTTLPGLGTGGAVVDAADTANAHRPRDTLVSSFYAVYPQSPTVTGVPVSLVAAPGGPMPDPAVDGTPALPEQPSRIFGTRGAGGGVREENGQEILSGHYPGAAGEAISPSLSTARLVAGDGDFASAELATHFATSAPGPDGVIDWAVGELTSSGQGIAFSTVPGPTPVIDTFDCSSGANTSVFDQVDKKVAVAEAIAKCQPRDDAATVEGARSRQLIRLPTYALNGFVFVPGSSTAWAVGDRGALVTLGGSAAAGSGGTDPAPPRLGTARPGDLPDASPYAGRLPQAQGPVGPVPPLDLQPEQRLDEPRLVPAGAPDPSPRLAAPREDVTEIVMSRDGTEGWALGNEHRTSAPRDTPGTTLFHFIGGRWTRCDTDDVPGVIEPDPACKALAPLRNAQRTNRPAPVPLSVAARVPLERDDDPSNDDEFEVMAFGDPLVLPGSDKERIPIVRYRDGRWSIDAAMTEAFPAMNGFNEPAALVFTAPDDGWLLVKGYAPALLRFDGNRWIDCHVEPAACGTIAGFFPGNYGGASPDDGDLAEVNGRVYVAMTRRAAGSANSQNTFPMVAFKDPGESDRWSVDPAEGGLDPGCMSRPNGTCEPSTRTEDQGCVVALSVAAAPGGGFAGWLTGYNFGGSCTLKVETPGVVRTLPGGEMLPLPETTQAMRMERTGGAGWVPWKDETLASYPLIGNASVLMMPDALGDSKAWLLPANASDRTPSFPLLAFRDDSWELAGSPFSTIIRQGHGDEETSAVPQAIAPDGRGGYWLAVRQAGTALVKKGQQVGFFHYTDRVRESVFEDAPHPVREPIAAAAGGADGSLWVATQSNVVYRYSRYTGWDRVAVPGWDPGRVVTRPSEASAIAVGPDGEGLLVGRGGRIAELSPVGARLDPAAGAALCGAGAAGPCGTGRNLRAVAIGPDGSAIAGGDGRAVMWRPAGESFRSVPPPPTAEDASITGVSLPQPSTAYLVTDNGQIWSGNPAGGAWQLENRAPNGRLLSVGGSGAPQALNAISLDANERGFAVGDGGVILQRTGDSEQPWRRIDEGIRDDLYSVAQPPTGDGALVGGVNGVIYTLSDGHFSVARTSDPWNPLTNAPALNQETARIIGLAILPGDAPAEVEAWAATRMPPFGREPEPQALLRYRSDGDVSEAIPQIDPLPDAPGEREGELTLAALGRTDCSLPDACPEAQDSNLFSDTVVRRTREELAARDDATKGPLVTVFTGDTAIAAGGGNRNDAASDVNVTQRSWVQFIAGGFQDAGLPLFGAIGLRDLSRAQVCEVGCFGTATAGVGTSTPWRQAMAGMPAPWGDEDPLDVEGVSFVPVQAEGGIDHPDGATSGSGAQTHYALDVVRDGEKQLRLVFADNSIRSLATSEPNQNPVEPGGQDVWLDAVLCRPGEGANCTRGATEPAVVVANTPPYSYGPGALSDTATDSSVLEQKLFAHDVAALLTGKLGWNGLTYARSDPNGTPVDHVPEPGGQHPASAPDPVIAGGEIIPEAIAASAGGRFGPHRDQLGAASEGYWHGYSVVRVPADGDPAGVIVEQRPIFDWIDIRPAPSEAATHVLRANRKLSLEGFGREVAGMDTPLRYDEITTPAITHRYDLLVADPEKPWLPLEAPDNGVRTAASSRVAEADPCGPYLCLDEKVGRIDDQSGQVKAGKGNYPRTFAIAALSVGAHSASYPLVFEPRASFRPPAPTPVRPPALPPPPANPTQPPQPGPPAVEALVPPVLPNLTAAQPPAPPLPPTPPPAESQAPLDLNLSPSSLDVTPPTAVSQPPTPPVNPAPPSGARREARQRQAAAQKSGADAEESAGDEGTGDLAKAPDSHDAAMTRHEFTAVAERHQPSAWARDALIGGGLGVAALILALGLRTARPTPRRREPEEPAPAWARRRR